jgi:hypothetical protein
MEYLVKALYYTYDGLLMKIEQMKIVMNLYKTKEKKEVAKDMILRMQEIVVPFITEINQ